MGRISPRGAFQVLALLLFPTVLIGQQCALDDTWAFDEFQSDYISGMATLPDGKVLMTGYVAGLGGVALFRTEADGDIDSTFVVRPDVSGYCIHRRADGTLLLPLNGASALQKFNADGTPYPGFTPPTTDGEVYCVTELPDGRLVVGGDFTTMGGHSTRAIALLEANGDVITGFTSPCTGPSEARDLAVDANGRVIVAGQLTVGSSVNGLMALSNTTGAAAAGFDQQAITGGGNAYGIWMTSSGKYYVCGNFYTYSGAQVYGLVRCLPDGTRDPSFIAEPSVFNLSFLPEDVVETEQGRVVTCGSRFSSLQSPFMYELDGNGALVNAIVCPGAPTTGGQRPLKLVQYDNSRLLVTWLETAGYEVYRMDFCIQTPWYADADGDGYGSTSMVMACSAPTGHVAITGDCNDGDPEVTPGATCNDGDPNTVADVWRPNCICSGENVSIAAKVFLGGPFNGGLMNDDLRVAGIIPNTEPYTSLGFIPVGGGGGQTTTGSVLATSGSDAIVDWVLLKLRGDSPGYPVIAARAALVQRDGDVVDTDGISPVLFSAPEGSYHLEVRHRNHLGVMTAAPLPATPTGLSISIDLTSATVACYGTDARASIGGVMTLWAGNSVVNGFLSYNNLNSDRDVILIAVGGAIPHNVVTGQYALTDLNMNGRIQYTGSGNDRDIILVNIGPTTPNNQRFEQIP